MNEKVAAFFQNEKLKVFTKKVFNKKTIIGAVIILILVVALRVTFSLMFVVKGNVNKVDGSKITVANFFYTKTVDIGNLQTTAGNIQVGDRIEIRKNLSGDIISVRDKNSRHVNKNGNLGVKGKNNFKGKQNFKGNNERNSNREK